MDISKRRDVRAYELRDIRAYEVLDNVQANLDQINLRYRRLQIIVGIKHGFAIGVIIFLGLKVWGIV